MEIKPIARIQTDFSENSAFHGKQVLLRRSREKLFLSLNTEISEQSKSLTDFLIFGLFGNSHSAPTRNSVRRYVLRGLAATGE